MRRLWLLIISAIFGLWLARVSGQAEWTVWLYHPDEGRLLHISAAGSVLDTQRIRVTSDQSLPARLIVAPDGTTAAHVTRNEADLSQQLIVTHLETGAALATIGLSELPEPYTRDDKLRLSPTSFNTDSTRLAYTEQIGAQGWTLFIFDLSVMRVTHSLTHHDALTSPYPPLHAGAVPYIQHVDNEALILTLTTSSVPRQHNYIWNYQSGQLVESNAAPSLVAAQYDSTGELVSPLPDWRFPAEHATLPLLYQQRNALHIYQPDGESRQAFYSNPLMDFQAVWFVQGGERVLAEAYIDDLNTWWILLERRGNEVERMPRAGYDVTATPDGFVYATTLGSQTALVHVNTRRDADEARTVWIDDGDWRVVWATHTRPPEAPPRWPQLAEPEPTLLPVNLQATPTLFPTALPVLRPGLRAQLQTAEDEFLNMRDAPSLSSTVLALLEDGVSVLLIDGPVAADGFVWWQIRVGGRLGWVVEALDDIQTVVMPAPTLEPTPTANAD